jgi:hypothetical protein
MRYLGMLLLIGLVVYCVVDIVRSEDHERLGAPAALWVLLVVLIPVLGSVAWLAVSRSRRAAARAGTGTGRPRSAPRPVAPDDDPEFLWRLDRERQTRRAEADGTTDETTDGATDAEEPPTKP